MNVQQLVEAIANLDTADALPCKLSVQEWQLLAPYLSMRFLKPGEPLIQEGECDRELFFLAEGELQVTSHGNPISVIKPGMVVGEGTFFSGQSRSATVTPLRVGVAWGLSWDKFEAMSNKQPKLAMDLIKGLAAVLAIRMREAVLVGIFT